MLTDLLNKQKIFKLVCAAGNRNIDEIEKLVMLYSLAGCDVFDVCASPEVIDAAKRGLRLSKIENNRYICVSLGIKDDPHTSKAKINSNCKKCNVCVGICPQNAIVDYIVDNSKCIGCSKCISSCKYNAIDSFQTEFDIKKELPILIDKGIDCIELHASGVDSSDFLSKWNDIKSLYNGMMSLCIDRSKLGNDGVINRIKSILPSDKKIIIQADGYPMSGGKDDFKSTLQAVAMAEVIQNANLPVYILLSGGTNSKTNELAKLCKLNINGIAIGSYARKIVKEYIVQDDFLTNKKTFSKALEIATDLVNTVKNG